MIQRNYARQLFGILMVILLFLGSLKSENIVWIHPAFAMTQETVGQPDSGVAKTVRLLPVDNLQREVDLQAEVCSRRMNRSTEEEVCRTVVLFMAMAIDLFMEAAFIGRLLYFGEKRIRVFRIISFVHQLDGKKKPPVLNI